MERDRENLEDVLLWMLKQEPGLGNESRCWNKKDWSLVPGALGNGSNIRTDVDRKIWRYAYKKLKDE